MTEHKVILSSRFPQGAQREPHTHLWAWRSELAHALEAMIGLSSSSCQGSASQKGPTCLQC